MNEEDVRNTLSVALSALNADIIKVVIPQIELLAGTGNLAFKFHCKILKDYGAFLLCSCKKKLDQSFIMGEKGNVFWKQC